MEKKTAEEKTAFIDMNEPVVFRDLRKPDKLIFYFLDDADFLTDGESPL